MLSACAARTPEQIADNEAALQSGRAAFALTPQIRMLIASAVANLIEESPGLKNRYVSAEVSEIQTQAGLKNVFGGDLSKTLYYCVRLKFLTLLGLRESERFVKLTPSKLPPNQLALHAVTNQRSGPIECVGVKPYLPFPELENALGVVRH